MIKPADSAQHGLRLLRVAIAIAVVLAIGLTTWITDKALSNPDVQTKRPSWLEETTGFSTSFWIPLILTVVVGIGLVVYVFVRAYMRIRAGEDLYVSRLGRGIRRRGEQHLQRDSEQL